MKKSMRNMGAINFGIKREGEKMCVCVCVCVCQREREMVGNLDL